MHPFAFPTPSPTLLSRIATQLGVHWCLNVVWNVCFPDDEGGSLPGLPHSRSHILSDLPLATTDFVLSVNKYIRGYCVLNTIAKQPYYLQTVIYVVSTLLYSPLCSIWLRERPLGFPKEKNKP